MTYNSRGIVLAWAGFVVGCLSHCIADDTAHESVSARTRNQPGQGAQPVVADQTDDLVTRWKLTLRPEKLPDIAPAVGKTWAQRSLRDILGRGTDRLVMLTAPEKQNSLAAIAFVTEQYHSVNTAKPPTKTTQKFDLQIGGPFLEYDGLLHTAVATDKVLILDALIKTADQVWYTATSRREDRDGKSEIAITEFVFNFDQDPFTNTTGTLVLKRHQSVLGQPDNEPTSIHTNYVVVRNNPKDHGPVEIQIGIPEKTSLSITLLPNDIFGMFHDRGTPKTVYLKE